MPMQPKTHESEIQIIVEIIVREDNETWTIKDLPIEKKQQGVYGHILK